MPTMMATTFSEQAPDAPLSTMIRPEDNNSPDTYEFILLSDNVEVVHSFSVKLPSGYNRAAYLKIAGEDDQYIEEIYLTQHLFNDDDLYEFILSNDNDYEEEAAIYNERGEFLGKFPQSVNAIYQLNDKIFLYAEYEEGSKGQTISALYTINKGGNSVAMMKNDASKLAAYPHPVKEDEELILTLPTPATADMIISVFSTNGSLLIKKDCKQGETEIKIPAYRLSAGVNPIVAMDAEGNIISTGKVIRE